jgi:hypothetical protein
MFVQSYGNGWSSSGGVAVEHRPYRGPGRHYSVPEVAGKTMIVKRPDPPMVRTPDHDTSIEGAATAELTKESVQLKLLAAWYRAGEKGFTDEECAEAAGLTDACYWKRAGELRAQGKIQYNGEKRKGRKGVARKVSVFVEE